MPASPPNVKERLTYGSGECQVAEVLLVASVKTPYMPASAPTPFHAACGWLCAFFFKENTLKRQQGCHIGVGTMCLFGNV